MTNVSRYQFYFYLILLGLMLALSACSSVQSAYKEADGLSENVYVTARLYARAAEEGRELGDVRVNAVIDNTKPVMSSAVAAAKAYSAVPTAEGEEAVQAALNNAMQALSDLLDAVRNAR